MAEQEYSAGVARAAVGVGVLDSGVGGLSVLREIHRRLPQIPTLYVADQAHLPYGPRSADEIRAFVEAIADFLIQRGAGVIVIACHSASAASLHAIRARYPHVPFVGMEPAVKPAAEATQTGTVGVLTTQATANGELYRSVCQRFAADVNVLTRIAPELVLLVEQGDPDSPEGRATLRRVVQPLLDAGADQIVLACTHFPFLADALRSLTSVSLVDPSAAVARQVERVLPPTMERDLRFHSAPANSLENRYFTSGDPDSFREHLRRLIGVEQARVDGVVWDAHLRLHGVGE